MKKYLHSHLLTSKTILFLFLMVTFMGNAQIMQVNILGGAVVSEDSTITIDAGNSVTFQIINTAVGNCSSVNVQDIIISDLENFSITPANPSENIKSASCNNGTKFLNFTINATSAICGSTKTKVTIVGNNFTQFSFNLTVVKAPIISVLGGNPSADVMDGATTTTATNGTNFGVVEAGLTRTRRFYIVNTGSCNLVLSSITSTNAAIDPVPPLSNFTITIPIDIYYPAPVSPGGVFYFDVTFTAGDPANNEALISITNNTAANTDLFTFTVKAEVFVTGPGPGGVTADFRLWLKATRGISPAVSDSKVTLWKDLGSNGKDAMQNIEANQPTYKDDATSNINFNPVIEFNNNNTDVEQFLYNSDNGFYSQDIFIVMIPNATITKSSNQQAIFGGVKSNLDSPTPAGTITGVGFGNYTSVFSDELITYMQESTSSYGIAETSPTKSYANAGIINIRNNATIATSQEMLYNSIALSTTTINSGSFANVGHIETEPNLDIVWGTKYWIGKNFSESGSLNGRVAEIMTFAQRVPDADRPKIETYLAIKYGITLGATTAEKNYINSAGTAIWDISANAGFNYNIAGIGKDDSSDLNHKQSKSINDANEVTIGLGVIAATNSENTNAFANNKDFLVWGCDNDSYTGTSTNTITIATGITTSLTRINRRWKIVETGIDVENVLVGIPSDTFLDNGFTKTADEEYVLIVSETENFTDNDIVDVIPLKIASTIYGITLDKEGKSSYQTWYDFDGTKYFTFGKAPKLTEKSAVNIGLTDYLVGEYTLNLNINAFTISAWVKRTLSASTRTIMAKGTKLQLRLNSADKIEVMVDNDVTPRLISNMLLNVGKWHHITFVYASGTIFLYIDGILDKSVQGVNPPTPNYNRFSIGAVYVSKAAGDIKNPFLGEIDEVYIWNQGLSQDQIRYLMNQEVEKVTGMVNGKALPQASPSNEITDIPWSTLREYYDFNTFYGTTVEGLTNDRNFLRIKYLNKTKTIVGTQTAPLPYVSADPGGTAWDDLGTWTNSAVQNLPNSLGLNGTRVDWNIVETSHNITSGDRNIEVLGLKINSGKITMDGTLDLGTGTGAGHGLRVSHYLKLDGEINLAGESQLVQDEGSILDEKSGGFLDKDQQGTASSYNYNYWSSSVGPISGNTTTRGTGIASTNSPFTIGGVIKDGRNSAAPADITYNTSPYAADSGSGTSLTISSYWLYQFYGKDGDYNSWFPRINENATLAPGVGYTMKGSSGKVPITSQQNYVYRGKPNNGDITLELFKTKINPSGDVVRLIGNPYPSAIDATEFILDNLSVADGGTNIEGNIFNGALYFWDHFGEKNSHYLKEYVGGYATRNLTAGAPAISNDSRIDNSGTLTNTVGKTPGQYIPVNQGFFVVTTLDDALTGITSVSGGNIVFKNSQRVFQSESAVTGPSVFMKAGKNKGESSQKSEVNTNTRPIVRLMYDSPTGYHRQIVMGMVENTSNHFDLGYDAPMADINKEDMYWTFDGAKFVIQGVPNFNDNQEFPLGLIVSKTGLATIKIDELENMDENISLHIKDKLTGKTHNISQKDFQIELEAGEYLDRFTLIFKMQKLVAEDVSTEILLAAEMQPIIEGLQVFMNNPIKELQIKNSNGEELLSVVLYNYLGQTIKTWNTNLNRRTVSLPINLAAGIYIVQINTKTGKTVKKISVE